MCGMTVAVTNQTGECITVLPGCGEVETIEIQVSVSLKRSSINPCFCLLHPNSIGWDRTTIPACFQFKTVTVKDCWPLLVCE